MGSSRSALWYLLGPPYGEFIYTLQCLDRVGKLSARSENTDRGYIGINLSPTVPALHCPWGTAVRCFSCGSPRANHCQGWTDYLSIGVQSWLNDGPTAPLQTLYGAPTGLTGLERFRPTLCPADVTRGLFMHPESSRNFSLLTFLCKPVMSLIQHDGYT